MIISDFTKLNNGELRPLLPSYQQTGEYCCQVSLPSLGFKISGNSRTRRTTPIRKIFSMRSYTLLWNEETWNEYRSASRGGLQVPIDYVAATDRGVFSNINPDDELFVISVKDGQVLVGGRLVAAFPPMPREKATQLLGRSDLISKDLYVLARKDKLDYFRAGAPLIPSDLRSLELTSEGNRHPPKFKENGSIDAQQFRAPRLLSEASAQLLRKHLGLDITDDNRADDFLESDNPDTSEAERSLRTVLARKGQPAFRRELLSAYNRMCCISKSKVVEILEAAHIDAYSETLDNSPRNGLLLRADIHTLFDLHLLTVDPTRTIRVSKTLKGTEYEQFHGKSIEVAMPSARPSEFALKRRHEKFLEAEQSR